MIEIEVTPEAAVEHRYVALVRGSSAIFPRGFLWIIPLWYAVAAYLLVTRGRAPSWYGGAALAMLALTALIMLAVLSNLRHNAFLADDNGVALGLRAAAARRRHGRRRRNRHLAWPEIQQVTIVYRPYGARLDIQLRPGLPPARQAAAAAATTTTTTTTAAAAAVRLIAPAATLIMPLSYLFRSPGLLAPRASPPRFRIQLWDVDPADVRATLTGIAPATVPITVVPRWRTRALGKLRRAEHTIRNVPV